MTRTLCGHRQRPRRFALLSGVSLPRPPLESSSAAGSRTFWNASPLHPRASSGLPNNTPPTLSARAGGVRGPAKWALRRERNWVGTPPNIDRGTAERERSTEPELHQR